MVNWGFGFAVVFVKSDPADICIFFGGGGGGIVGDIYFIAFLN